MAQNVKERTVVENRGKNRARIALSAILVIAVLALSIAPIIGCFGSCNDENIHDDASRGRVVATVNGIDITEGDVVSSLLVARIELQSEYPQFFSPFDGSVSDYNAELASGVTVAQALRERAVRVAAVSVLMEQEAQRLGVELTREDLDMINSMVEGSREELDANETDGFNIALAEVGFRNASDLSRMFRHQALMSTVLEAIAGNPAEFARFEQYLGSNLLGAQHILSGLGSHPDGRPIMRHEADAEAIAAANARANGIMTRINAGEDFETLMFEYSTDPGLAGNPQGYTFGPNQMVPEFEQGTRDLEIGEISGVISAPHGYHIIRRVEPEIPEPNMQSMMMAALQGFEAMVEDADIVFLPVLSEIWLGTAYDE